MLYLSVGIYDGVIFITCLRYLSQIRLLTKGNYELFNKTSLQNIFAQYRIILVNFNQFIRVLISFY
jgi:hypothetical protein